MLTEQQLDFIFQVSSGTHGGLVLGAVCGLLVTAAMLIKDRKTPAALLDGIVPGAIAGAISAAVFSCVSALIQATYCEPGPKGGYSLTDRVALLVFAGFSLVTLSAAAIAARLAIARGDASKRTWSEVRMSAIAWAAIGAAIGAIAGVGLGFDGYYVKQSNAGPIRSAITGAALLAVGCLLWRLTMGLCSSGAERQAGKPPGAQLRLRTVFVFVWAFFLLVVALTAFGTRGIAVVLATALWFGVVVVGRWNVRLAWLCWMVFCAAQPLMVAVSHSGWSFVLSDSNTFPRLDTIGEALHLLSLALCGPLVWLAANMGLDTRMPTLGVLAPPLAGLFQAGLAWWLGDLLLRRQSRSPRRCLAVLALAVFLIFGSTFVLHYHLF